jgi:exodeoxyribonuclease V alpha subunit
MIRSEKVPTAVLDTIFRQASNSRIIVNAHAINHNDTHLQYGDDFQMLEVQNAEDAAQLVVKNYLQEVSQHGLENVQILSPFRKRGAVASNALNETIRDLVNPASKRKMELKCGSRVFRVGDRIMQTANRNGVSNGDVGLITGMVKVDDEVFVDIRLLDGRELRYSKDMMEDVEFSYCLTIHKSQGQEYPVIIVPLLKEHYIMLRRNLLYTAVTRAKAKVILIGQRQAVYIAIHKCDVGQRNTVLADRIVAYYNREMSKRVA